MISPRPLLSVILALGLASSALPAWPASFAGYGVRTGIASSAFLGDGLAQGGSRTGFAATLFSRFSLGRWFSIQPELGWTSKGAEGDVVLATGTSTFTASVVTRVDYLEIPLLLHLNVPVGTHFEPYFVAGPGVALRTGSSQEITLTGSQYVYGPARIHGAQIFEEVGTLGNPQFHDVDWTVIAGGGLALGRAPLRVVLDSRYVLGLTGVYPGADWSLAHNGSWTTTLGIEIR